MERRSSGWNTARDRQRLDTNYIIICLVGVSVKLWGDSKTIISTDFVLF